MYEPLLPRNGLSVFSNDDAMSYDLRFFIRDDIWIFLLEGFNPIWSRRFFNFASRLCACLHCEFFLYFKSLPPHFIGV